MAKTVFLSYSHKNSKKVNKIVNQLREVGYEIWIDKSKLRGGEKWNEEIANAIAKKDVFLFCMSAPAFGSKYVRKELYRARELEKPIIPILLSKAIIPTPLKFIEKIQWIDAKDPKFMEKLIQAIENEKGGENTEDATNDDPIKPQPGSTIINIGGDISGTVTIGTRNSITQTSTAPERAPEIHPAKIPPPSARSGPVDQLASVHDDFLKKYIVDHRHQQRQDEKWFEKMLEGQFNDTYICEVVGVHGIGKTSLLRYISHPKQTFMHYLRKKPNNPYIDLAKCDSRNPERTSQYPTPQAFIEYCKELISENQGSQALVIDHVPSDSERNEYISAFEREILVPFLSEPGKIVVMALETQKSRPWVLDALDANPRKVPVQLNGWDGIALEEYSNKNPNERRRIEEYKNYFGGSASHIPLLVEYILKFSTIQEGISAYLRDYLRAHNENEDILPIFAVVSWVDQLEDFTLVADVLSTLFSETIFSNYPTAKLIADLRNISWIDNTYQWVQPIRTALKISTNLLVDDLKFRQLMSWIKQHNLA